MKNILVFLYHFYFIIFLHLFYVSSGYTIMFYKP